METIKKEHIDWLNVAKTYKSCPYCQKGILNTRVKRGFLVKNVLLWVDVKRFQCDVCGKKVYLKNNSGKYFLFND